MVHIDAPTELISALESLRPNLERKGVASLRAFAYHRPGEESYWLAYAYIGGARRVVGTPDLRDLPLSEQAPQLLERLQAWVVEGEGCDESPREAGMAAGMYAFDDQDYVRAARRGRQKS